MKSSRTSSSKTVSNDNNLQDTTSTGSTQLHPDGYQWTALSVTTVGALLASIQGSALLIVLPDIMEQLKASFFVIMWVLLSYLLILTVLTPIIGRLADIWGRKSLYNSGFVVLRSVRSLVVLHNHNFTVLILLEHVYFRVSVALLW